MILSFDAFYLARGKFSLPKRIGAHIRTSHFFKVGVPPPKLSLNEEATEWQIRLFNGEVLDRRATFLTKAERQAEKSRIRDEFSYVVYSDGLGPNDLDIDLFPEIEQLRLCLAHSTRLFKEPLTSLITLWGQAIANLDRAVLPELIAQEFAPHEPVLCWSSNASTLLYPEQGQTTLFFHSVKLTLAIRQNQCLLVDRLSSLRRRGANGRWHSYFSANILRKLRNAVDRPEQPTTGHLRYWSSPAWGAVPLLLRYVDPDLLILLLPPEVRRDLAQEVDAWQKFVHRTLTELLSYPNAKLPDTHILRNPNTGVRKRGEKAPEGQELAQSLEKKVGISDESISEPVSIVELDGFISIPESHLALLEKTDPDKAREVKKAKATLPARYRPQPGIFYLSDKDKHLFAPNTPLLPSKMLTKAEGNEGSRIEYDEDLKEMVIRDYTEADIGRAINELVSRQCKILRHALENARLLKEELIAPDAIVALTVSELSRELRQIIDDQIRELARKRARPEEVNDQPKANDLDAKLKQILAHTEDLKLRAAVDELLTLRKNIPDKTRAPKEYERLRKQRYRLWERIKKIQMTVTSNDKKNEVSPTLFEEIEAEFAEEQTKVSLEQRAAYDKGHN